MGGTSLWDVKNHIATPNITLLLPLSLFIIKKKHPVGVGGLISHMITKLISH